MVEISSYKEPKEPIVNSLFINENGEYDLIISEDVIQSDSPTFSKNKVYLFLIILSIVVSGVILAINWNGDQKTDDNTHSNKNNPVLDTTSTIEEKLQIYFKAFKDGEITLDSLKTFYKGDKVELALPEMNKRVFERKLTEFNDFLRRMEKEYYSGKQLEVTKVSRYKMTDSIIVEAKIHFEMKN